MATVISNSLEPFIETWDDPGDYPSNAGSGPLPSYNYLAGMEGECVIQLNTEELQEAIMAHGCTTEGYCIEMQDFIGGLAEELAIYPKYVDSISRWDYQLSVLEAKITVWQHEDSKIVDSYEDEDYESDWD